MRNLVHDFQKRDCRGHDRNRRRNLLTRPNGINTNYSYDPASSLLQVLHKLGTTILDGATYTYDNAENRKSRTDKRLNTTLNFTFDNIYQLKTAKQGTTTKESYTYDAVGNRLSSLGVSPYHYNVSNELTDYPGVSYTYDANGNTKTKTDGSGQTTYNWDFDNRLTSVVLPGTGGTVSFKYDPFGRRVQKSFVQGGNTTTTDYIYEGPNLLEEVDQSGNVLARYTQGPGVDEPLAELRSGATNYYEADWLGSVTSLSNSSGALANTYTYDSYGKLTASTGTVTNPFRYTGRELDSETGAYFYRARYYDQNIGRFLSEDPIGFDGGTNFYRYARNNPAGFIDPSGDVVINPGRFPNGSVADVVLALQRIRDGLAKNPGCDCYFRSHGSRSLSSLIDDPYIWINFNPKRTSTPRGWAHGETFPTRDPNDMWLFPDSTSAGIDDIGWTIVHELYHLNNPGGSEDQAETAASKCAPITTINITVRPKP